MNIASQITRIQSDRDQLRTKAIELKLSTKPGVDTPAKAITNTSNLDEVASAFDSIEDQGSISAQVKEGETYTIPKGYHDGTGTISGVAGGGNYSLQSKTVTPTKANQQITPDDGYYGLSDVTVNAIPDAYQNVTSVTAGAADVLTGKVIVDKTGKQVAGTMANNGAVDKKLDTTTPSYTVPAGYHNGKGTVKITLEEKTATPTKSTQNIAPTAGSVLSNVRIEAIPAKYQDVSSVTAGAGDVLAGKKVVAADGSVVEGTMPNNGAISKTIDGLTATSVTIAAGYTSGGTVSLTDDIEQALAAI